MNQVVIDSSDFVDSVNKLISNNNFSKIIIVTGKNLENKVFKSKFIASENLKIFVTEGPYPEPKQIHKLISLLNIEKPDLIIAIGGGRIIDTVKQANKLHTLKTQEEIKSSIKDNAYKNLLPLAPVVVIPTTAGTGSEATQFAVIYIDEKKYSVDNKDLLPEFVIHDSNLLRNIRQKIIASTAMDALTQAIESMWAVKSTKESKVYASESIKLIRENIMSAYESRNNDETSTKKIQTAAYLSGKAINITRTTAPHAISYPLTVHYNIPHGHSVAMVLRHFIKINSMVDEYEVVDPRGKDYVKGIMQEIINLFDSSSIEDCQSKFDYLLKDISLEVDFKEMGIGTDSDIEIIIKETNLDRLNNNPVKISTDDIRNIFK